MISYTTGDLLKSDAEALVNTVNCEGYMGKGIAYQFKLLYPENNASYVKACKDGSLRIGAIHYFVERGKMIINFPTKDKWRKKSEMEYISLGLDALVDLMQKLGIRSIAIPPLGSGNGGLIWAEVKQLIEGKLQETAVSTEVIVYEPSKSYSSSPLLEPKLSASALVLMEIKLQLQVFNKFRLQKTAYFVDVFSKNKYFKFSRHLYGPYDHSIDIISKGIKEFQIYHAVKDTGEAKAILYKRIVSESVDDKLSGLMVPIQKACQYVNAIDSDHDLECLSTICFLIQENTCLEEDKLVVLFKAWSEDKASRFTEEEILSGISKLCDAGVIEKSLLGYRLPS